MPTIRTVAALSAASLLVVGQLYATLPLLNELSAAFGVSVDAAAWTSSVFGFAYAAGMLIAGPVSDVLGRRRVAVCGLAAAATASLIVSLAPTFPALLATRALQGFAAAFFPPVALAYLTERIDERHRTTALTTVISSFLAAAVVAPLSAQALAAVGDWRTWFQVSALVLLVLAGLHLRVLRPDIRRKKSASVGTQLVRLPRLLRSARLSGLYLTTITVMWAFVGVSTLAQLTGPGTADHPATMQAVRIATLPACLLIPLLAPALARVPARRRLITALAVTAAAIATAAFATGPYTLAIALAAMTAGVVATAPALVETIGATSQPAQRGSATALYGFTLFVGASLAAPTAVAAQGLGFPTGAAGIAAVLTLGIISATAATHPQVAEPVKS